MPIFEYLTFLCNQDELQDRLTACGLERWRLHTCEPVVIIGSQGSGLLHVLVVLDRTVEESSPEVEPGVPDFPVGIAMNDFRPDRGKDVVS